MLSLLHIADWISQRKSTAHLLFAITSLSVVPAAIGEIGASSANSVQAFGLWLRWSHVSMSVAAISLVLFIRVYLDPGRSWLAPLVVLSWCVQLSANALGPFGTIYGRSLASIERVTWPVANVGLQAFAVEAAVRHWRRGGRRRAVLIGGTIFCSVLAGGLLMGLPQFHVTRIPFAASFTFLPIVVAIALELSRDAVRAASTVCQDEAAGASGGFVSVGKDTTDQDVAEEARDDALAQLREALAERDRALAAGRDALTRLESLEQRPEDRVITPQSELAAAGPSYGIFGTGSDAMRYVLHRIDEVAPLHTTVLIEGETGVGKELVARAIHARSPLKDRPMVMVNCAVLPPGLVEDELFGHERGAYTGASRIRKGRFELADRSTLFLDEVGELPMDLQGKLLRVLQDGEIERLGGDKTLKVSVRTIAATNKNLASEVERGRFRPDLYYRLQAYPLTVSPLRKRREDIPSLAEAFVREFAAAQGKRINRIPESVLEELSRYDWPGNVRELRNVIERAVIHTTGDTLRLGERLANPALVTTGEPEGYRGKLKDVERRYIESILERCAWRIEGTDGAAELLGLHPNTLRHRMGKLGIKRPSLLRVVRPHG
jgi:DNA-binding NtrC family response regulator